jgi:hypothetical protein
MTNLLPLCGLIALIMDAPLLAGAFSSVWQTGRAVMYRARTSWVSVTAWYSILPVRAWQAYRATRMT